MTYNIYCDESCYLLNSNDRYMVLGAIICPKDSVKAIHNRIRDIKSCYGISPDEEVKWTKISRTNASLYEQLVNYFFDREELGFRAIIIDKQELDHDSYGQTHEDWYYKMMFQLIHTLLDSGNDYNIYLDYKDTQSGSRSSKLLEVLRNSQYDFNSKIIKGVQCLPSHEVGLIQLCDIFMGAIAYDKRGLFGNPGKVSIVNRIKKMSGKTFRCSTLPSERRFNLFFWHGVKRHD